LKPQISGKH